MFSQGEETLYLYGTFQTQEQLNEIYTGKENHFSQPQHYDH